MHLYYKITSKFTILLIAVILLFTVGCTRRVPPWRSDPDIDKRTEGTPYFHNIESSADRRQLTGFLDGGFGRRLDNNGAGPHDIINTAYEYLGVRHCMGGRTKRCIDCSGLLVAVFGEHGIHLPHSSEEQARFGRILSAEEELREGDLVFFVRSYRTPRFITHSGIYAGNNRFIHTSSRSGVVVTPLNNPYWKSRYVFATRIFY